MTVLHLDANEYATWIASPFVDEEIAGQSATSLVVVHELGAAGADLPTPGSLPVVVCGVGDQLGDPGPSAFDVIVGSADLPTIERTAAETPRAAVALAVLLRSQALIDVDAGLAAESAVYSMLQAGPEFSAWRAERPPRKLRGEGEVVLTTRSDDVITLTMNRPHRHNAITAQLRDELVAGLAIARTDESVTAVELRGNGPSFCSGGDLDEFGARADPVTAHVTRLARSPARVIHELGNVTAFVHGTTVGGGIEMAAFARRVVADPDATFGLPEVGLGLVPGAGGTVSLTRRIGRQRTAALALTGATIDARTALAWRLVDAVQPVG